MLKQQKTIFTQYIKYTQPKIDQSKGIKNTINLATNERPDRERRNINRELRILNNSAKNGSTVRT